MRLGWRRGTRAFVVGITLLVVAIAVLAGRHTGAGHSPLTATPLPSRVLPATCHTATLAGSSYTVCEESTPATK